MNFNGTEVTPMGNAKLTITPNNTLKVENIGSSGIDGVLINTKDNKNPHVYFAEVPEVINGSYKISTLATISDNVAITIEEKITWYDKKNDMVKICYNTNLLSKKFAVVGKLKGSEVFNEDYDNPITGDGSGNPVPSESLGWWSLGVTIAALAYQVYKDIKAGAKAISHYNEYHEEYYPNGVLKSKTNKSMTDPEPIQVKIMGKDMLLDEYGCISINNYTEKQNISGSYSTQICITGFNTDKFEISSIE